MSHLLVKPNKAQQVHDITPESANWEHVGFSLYDLMKEEELTLHKENRELCLVVLSGTADISVFANTWKNVGDRGSVFENKAPGVVYIPINEEVKITANTEVELAVCSAPGKGLSGPARLIEASNMPQEIRGEGSNTRHVRNILPETEAADGLLVVEVITPSGNWSSYPPHKHDSNDLPRESKLEETYYHRLDPSSGYIHQRVYTDNRSIDETISAEDRDVVMVPEGYHPVGVPHGYTSYYLNVMAGPIREWHFANDPAHEWIIKK